MSSTTSFVLNIIGFKTFLIIVVEISNEGWNLDRHLAKLLLLIIDQHTKGVIICHYRSRQSSKFVLKQILVKPIYTTLCLPLQNILNDRQNYQEMSKYFNFHEIAFFGSFPMAVHHLSYIEQMQTWLNKIFSKKYKGWWR